LMGLDRQSHEGMGQPASGIKHVRATPYAGDVLMEVTHPVQEEHRLSARKAEQKTEHPPQTATVYTLVADSQRKTEVQAPF